MNKDLEILHNVFFSENIGENDIKDVDFPDFVNEVNEKFNLSIPKDITGLKAIVEEIYHNDNGALLISLIEEKTPSPFGFDLDYCPTDFESADWTDDNEHRDIVEEEYGEEGYNLYFVKTKSRLFVFSQMRWGNGDYELYDEK